MTTESPSNPDRGSQESLPQIAQFRAIEALNEFYAANGWASEYVQISAGTLRIEVGAEEVGDITLGREQVNQRVVGSARSGDDMFSILVSLGGLDPIVNGHHIGENNLLLISPGSDMDIVMDAGTDVATVAVPRDMFVEHLLAVGDDDSLLATKDIADLQLQREQVDSLRRSARELMSGRSDQKAPDSVFVSRLARAMVRQGTRNKVGDRYCRLSRHRVVKRAREYIHAHLEEPILVPDLCSHCGVGLRTLERTFKSSFGTTPKRYILAARLNAARRDLLNADLSNIPIAHIAMGNGFAHMGRFARNYKRIFGHLPSADRKLAYKKH